MTRPNQPARLDRIARARALVIADREQSVHPRHTLDAFEDLGASIRCHPVTNTLRYCGIAASCTWSADRGLLDAWEQNAARALARSPQENPADA